MYKDHKEGVTWSVYKNLPRNERYIFSGSVMYGTLFAMVPSSDYILPLRPVGYFCSYFEETSPGKAVIHMWPGRQEVLAKKLADCQEPP